MSGRGGNVADFSRECGDVEAKLFGFGVNSAELRGRHIAWLDDYVVPILADGGSLSLVGEASRTGTNRHNQGLSVDRAHSVLEYVRRHVHGPVRGLDATMLPFEVPTFRGVGERAAARVGQRDGTEDAYYRAVRVRAWARPNPPAPPAPRTRPPTMVRQIISRRWRSSSTRTPGGGNPWHDGEGGALLGDLINNALQTATRGGSDTRAYHEYPADWCIVRVHDDYTIDDHLWTGPVSTTTYTHVMQYEYGPCTPMVTLFKTITVISKAGTRRVDRSTRSYPRTEIWQHTTAPHARVLG